jgi:polyisoprenoid-binding protein YceI
MSTITQNAVQTYTIDPSHSRLGFTVRHLGFSKVRGSFGEFEGVVRMEGHDLSTLEAEAVVRTESITTNDVNRDNHLRTADFFLIEEYPTLTFKSTGVRRAAGSAFTLAGELTLRGVTKAIELEGEYLGSGRDPWGNAKVAFEARTKINRKDYGLSWNAVLETGGFLVSDDVEITLEIQAALQQDEA